MQFSEIEPEFFAQKPAFFKKKKISLNKSLVFSESKIKLENSEECREHENKRENRLPLMGDHHVD